MPDEALNDKGKASALLVTVILVVAIVVLVVDWQIKSTILAESAKLRASIDSFERRYWNGQKASVPESSAPSDPLDGNSAWDHVVVRTPTMEEGNDRPRGVTSIGKVARPLTSVDPGSGSPSVALPEGDREA